MAKNIFNNKTTPKLGKISGGGAGKRFGPTQKPKNAKKTLLRLMMYFRFWHKSIIMAIVLTQVSSLFLLLTPWLLGEAVNTFNLETHVVNQSLLNLILVALVASHLVTWFLDTVLAVMMAEISQQLVKHIREDFFAKLQGIPLNFYDTRANGDTMSRMTNDVDNVSSVLAQTTTELFSSIFSILFALVMMLILSPKLTLLAMVTIPLLLVLTKTIAGRSRSYFFRQQQKLGALNGVIEESIDGLKMVKAFNRQLHVLNDFKRLNQELLHNAIKAQIWSGFLMPFMNVLNNLSFALIAGAGGVLVLRGEITVGVIISFLSYSKYFGRPLNHIAGMFNDIQSALAGAERVFEILDEEEEVPDKIGARKLTHPCGGKVEFRNVSFAYKTGVRVLENVSFQVQPGEVIALVGGTGSGKTTIVNLLTRFYEVDGGQILIDDLDITEIKRQNLRSCFSVVLQDTFLFTGTIVDNIRYSRPSATDNEVKKAAKLAHADGFISRLPRGYDTVITGSTDNLSQGQKQLLAIARAILGNGPILILDEATSSVDTKTEKAIHEALSELLHTHTSFLIAHRLSTIRDADQILVIVKGRIMEKGTHQELMAQRGTYYEMVISQTGQTVLE